MSSSDSAVTEELSGNEESFKQYLRPYSVVVKNLPSTSSQNYTALGHHIAEKLHFNVQKVLSVRGRRQESGYAILEFGNTEEDFKEAMLLHIHFDSAQRGKFEWEMPVHTPQPYGWLADPEDINDFVDKADQFMPTSIPWEWIEEAFAAANDDTRKVYCTIKLFATRFAYMKFT